MRIDLQEGSDSSELNFGRADIALVGVAVDERGRDAITWSNGRRASLKTLTYDPEAVTLSIDGKQTQVDGLERLLEPYCQKTILLEATTLGFVEIFLCARALVNLQGSELTLLYVEPWQYLSPRRTQLLHRREFELSQRVPGYLGVPGATLVTTARTNQRAVFFLGYEERRLDVALELEMVRPSDIAVVFGVPAFTPGWEMNAFANNIGVIRDKNVSGGIYFCGAENPASAYKLLDEIYDSLSPKERLIVGPIGTKPNGIAAALFAAEHKDIGLLYDHPIRSRDRTEKTAGWHLFTARF
jgi:hypothetical protein